MVIKDQAFYGCTHLSRVYFTRRLEVIEEKAFGRWRSLRTIKTPCTIKAINDGAFEDCLRLLEANFGNGLEMIGAGAFCACISLHHIDIPRAIRSIQKVAFAYCLRLMTLVLQQWSCGDGGTGICLLHFPCMPCATPHRDRDQQ